MAREPGLREAKKERTRVDIAHAALTLFLEHGFEETSITDIATAAGVSKMTVFNYFPAKEEMFFWFVHRVMPDLGQVVRDRVPGEAPIDAVHRFLRAELERRAEWTGLHDGVSQFTRLTLASPTLINGFDRIWRDCEQELLAALAETVEVATPPSGNFAPLPVAFAEQAQNPQNPQNGSVNVAAPTSELVLLRIAVGQILSAIQTLVVTNQTRQSLGITADASAPSAYQECDAAFELLRTGLGDYGTQAADSPRGAGPALR
jgi:AcrR family transcriptional regulator